jgi:hypothetical protein
LLQALGRAGIYKVALPQDNIFINYVSLEGLVYLLHQLNLPDAKAKSDGGAVLDITKLVPQDEYQLMQLENIKEIVCSLVLPTRCLAITFEMMSGNLYMPPPAESDFEPACGQHFTFC